MERMVELSLSATHNWRPSRERARPEGCAQLVEGPARPFWLRSYPSPLKAAVAPVLMSCLQIWCCPAMATKTAPPCRTLLQPLSTPPLRPSVLNPVGFGLARFPPCYRGPTHLEPSVIAQGLRVEPWVGAWQGP